MDREILDVFIDAIRQVFRETEIAIDSVTQDDDPPPEDNVITSVGLTGDLRGIFMLRTDMASAAAILLAMTGSLRVTLKDDKLSEIQMAALGELSNQIMWRAITLLFERQKRCDITPPAVIAAQKMQSLVPDLAVSFSRTIRGPFGRLTAFLGIQEDELPKT